MADLLFKCPECSKHLAVDATSSNSTLTCPDCGQTISIPRVAILFKCPSCFHELAAPSNIAGERFHCSKCEVALVVPEPRRCPACGFFVALDTIACGACGTDLQTGKRPDASVPVGFTSKPRKRFPWPWVAGTAAMLVILAAVMWSWHVADQKDAVTVKEEQSVAQAKTAQEEQIEQAQADAQRQAERQRLSQLMAVHQRWVEEQRSLERQQEAVQEKKAEEILTLQKQRKSEEQKEKAAAQQDQATAYLQDRVAIARELKPMAEQVAAMLIKKGSVISASINGFVEVQTFGANDEGADAIAMIGVDWTLRGSARKTSGFLLFRHHSNDGKWRYQPVHNMADRTAGN